jgi:protein-L-isoaspartate(D-aspartate) O-methyltransferase
MADNDFNCRNRMVETQIEARGIVDPLLLQAMREVPREKFVPEALAEFAYDDTPLPIAEGQTISQPYIVARMIEAAAVRPGDRVLEVGTGSGYAAAVLARVAGQVFTIERHKVLADAAELRLARLAYGKVTVIAADGSGGLPEQAPFDAILVAARTHEVPEALKRQLAMGGRLVIPVGGEDVQALCRITRIGEAEWTSDDLASVRFVPLIGAHGLAEDSGHDRRSKAVNKIALQCRKWPRNKCRDRTGG